MTQTALLQAELPLPLLRRGKVRDNYDLGDKLLMVATDRVSAFDVVLPNPIPGKGQVLTRLSAFWFQKTASLVPNHFLELVTDPARLKAYFPPTQPPPAYLSGRSMLVKKAQRIPVECVVRGYLAGSAYEDYRRRGEVQGHPLPPGMKECQRLTNPLFTPTTKEETGHDQPLGTRELVGLVGPELGRRLEEIALRVYEYAHSYALGRGLIIADTKMEFGLADGGLILIDELLTPDSSRFWARSGYEPGRPQPSYDKQPLRDWLLAQGWNREPPAPSLPPHIVAQTARLYQQACSLLTGEG